jgi:hypothetical protein
VEGVCGIGFRKLTAEKKKHADSPLKFKPDFKKPRFEIEFGGLDLEYNSEHLYDPSSRRFGTAFWGGSSETIYGSEWGSDHHSDPSKSSIVWLR